MTYELRTVHEAELTGEITLADLHYVVELLLKDYPKGTVLRIEAAYVGHIVTSRVEHLMITPEARS